MTVPHPLLGAFAAAGISDHRIARHYGVSECTVLRWRKTEGIESRWHPRRSSHGSLARYNAGCRCDSCRMASTDAARRKVANRRRITDLNGGVSPIRAHGLSAATNHGCRCDVCIEAVRVNNATKASPLSKVIRDRAQRESKRHARRNGFMWTGPEIELADRRDLTARQVASMIGRTLAAVMNMRRRIREEEPKIMNLLGKVNQNV